MSVCVIDDCGRPVRCRSWCLRHYEKWRKYGDPLFSMRQTDAERFWAKVQVTDWCWIWAANINPNGYGYFYYEGSMQPAHRAAWKLLMGPIPDGYEVDHLCKNTVCVNPNHLEPVPPLVNKMRSDNLNAKYADATHCEEGHELTENPWGGRQCLPCKNVKLRETRRLTKLQEQGIDQAVPA